MAIIPGTFLFKVDDDVNNILLNIRIRDPINFLLNKPFAVLRKSATQALSTGTWTSVTWNIEDVDSDSGHDNSSNTERYTAKTEGWYLVQATVGYQQGFATAFRKMHIRKNGLDTQIYSEHTTHISGTVYQHHQSTSAYVYLLVNDWIECRVWQDSGSSINLMNDAVDSRMEVMWVCMHPTENLPMPSNYSWSPGLLSVADLNVNMRDAYLSHLMPPMAVYTIKKGSQELGNSFAPYSYSRLVEWDTIELDTYDCYQDGIFVAPRDGWYHTVLQVKFEDYGVPGASARWDRAWTVARDLPVGTERFTWSPSAVLYGNFAEQGPNYFSVPARDSYTIFGDVQLFEGQTLGVTTEPGLAFGTSSPQSEIGPDCRWTIRWVCDL